jgi:hypothetical protein
MIAQIADLKHLICEDLRPPESDEIPGRNPPASVAPGPLPWLDVRETAIALLTL